MGHGHLCATSSFCYCTAICLSEAHANASFVSGNFPVARLLSDQLTCSAHAMLLHDEFVSGGMIVHQAVHLQHPG